LPFVAERRRIKVKLRNYPVKSNYERFSEISPNYTASIEKKQYKSNIQYEKYDCYFLTTLFGKLLHRNSSLLTISFKIVKNTS